MIFKKAIINLLALGGIPRIIQRFQSYNSVTVLAYHCVVDKPLDVWDWCFLDKEQFRKQIRYLVRSFKVVSLSEAVQRIQNNQIEEPTAVITFDDGFHNIYSQAFPILQEFNVPATIFLATGTIGSDRTIWFTRLLRAIIETQSSQLKWNGEQYYLHTANYKKESSLQLQATLKLLPAPLLEKSLCEIEERLGFEPDSPIPDGSVFRMLTNDTIQLMRDSGLIEFGAHTVNHTILSKLDSSLKKEEIQASTADVELMAGDTCRFFAYPNGRLEDFDSESMRLLKEMGIEAAVTMVPGQNKGDSPMMELNRYGIGADISMSRFKLIIHHIL
ncbi:MAG: polysaccharide deacetylase family protein [Candidatus Thiodiazotropha weberae]|nr:polysaccharide deacetylase family protein [Candidatus Thiodiazotropha lotti]MCG8011224.1 polysaccharide deacetylase family protein [Candidatus Thiodiazotropha lotti]MCW4210686.1 polysaccharide deacetylase family protein [Candidatus Thiodiazotropha lotti]MCW4216417.1 polysaccharide deacetylase family protein [Candidatus Thiodiazotropha lotti]